MTNQTIVQNLHTTQHRFDNLTQNTDKHLDQDIKQTGFLRQASADFQAWLTGLPAVFRMYWLHWLAGVVLTSMATLIAYTHFDKKLARYFYQMPKSNTLRKLAAKMTYYGKTEWYALPALVVYAATQKKYAKSSRLKRATISMAATLAASGAVVNSIKPILARPRPKMTLKPKQKSRWYDLGYNYGSFPSGHSATSVGAWVLFALILSEQRAGGKLPLLLAGGIVGGSLASTRMIITAHYLSDVIAGSAIGGGIALLMYQTLYQSDYYQ